VKNHLVLRTRRDRGVRGGQNLCRAAPAGLWFER